MPHVILPMWVDLYTFAALSETIGVGVWGCKKTSPEWTAECLEEALLATVDGRRAATSVMQEKARMLGEEVRLREKGRDVAAREIAKLAYVR